MSVTTQQVSAPVISKLQTSQWRTPRSMLFLFLATLSLYKRDRRSHRNNNNKGFTVGVFIDFQSAFDMMWQNGLLIKLKKLGITGNVFSFIKKNF